MVHVLRRRRRLTAACVALTTLFAAAIPAASDAAAAATPSATGRPATAPSGSPASGDVASGASPVSPVTPAASSLPSQRTGVVPGEVIVALGAGTSVTGRLVGGTKVAARLPLTSNAALNTALRAAGATTMHPLFPNLSQTSASSLTRAAAGKLGSGPAVFAGTYVIQTGDKNSTAVAQALQGTPGVAFAEPDRYVNTMDTGAQPLPAAVLKSAPATPARAGGPAASASGGNADDAGSAGVVPTNYALSDSAQALLNAGGVNATGAFSLLGTKYHQLPGAGEIVTDVTTADLTDASMAAAGDRYVQQNGPTTVLINGGRYFDLPSMPLIPTYVADPGGTLNPSESIEGQDPTNGESLLDFSVMSPLPDGSQRSGMTGSGYTDLLGIAPGSNYRLVVPQQPTVDDIAQALISSAQQTPRPNVITSTLGFGTDTVGYPGRYLEDDPLIRAVIAAIVNRYGIVVTVSANDGTRLFTPAAVGPDGGSTPTNLAPNASSATTINDVELSTTPSLDPDTGSIDVGGSTLDDTLADGTAGPATTAETRVSGFGIFSSGFGTRVDASAPSDNIVAFSHALGQSAEAVNVSLNGGTSASAPEVAAAAAVVLQAGRLARHPLSPVQVRSLLERTGRAVPTPAQIDQPLQVGPQVDVTAATEAALGLRGGKPSIVRLSVAHRVTLGNLGGSFLETTDPDYLDLDGVTNGPVDAGLTGPVTFGADVIGLPAGVKPQYTLTVGKTTWHSASPAIRITPTQLLTAAGLPVIATADRTVDLTFSVLIGGRVRAAVGHTLTVGPSTGQYIEEQAPKAPAVAPLGKPVTVSYDLTGVTGLDQPELLVTTAGHWNSQLAPYFTTAWSTPLTATRGIVTIPASAFKDGGGIYGIGVLKTQSNVTGGESIYSEFAPIRISGSTAAQRPAAPLLSAGSTTAAHYVSASRAEPGFSLHYSVRGIRGATSALVEFSAPGPTIHGAFNTYSNANGTELDHDGVDTPSVAHVTVAGLSGTVRLNALKLGLRSSLDYGVRILAVNSGGQVVGQASPVSTLEFDDGLTPTGQQVFTFAVAGADSLAAVLTATGGTEVVHFDPTRGTYGAVMASDGGVFSDYEVLGVDLTTHRALLAHRASPAATTMALETWNTTTNTMVGSVTVDNADYTFIVGQVDGARNRGVALLQSVSTPDDSELMVINLADGSAAAPAPLVSTRPYGELTIDPATGEVYIVANTPHNIQCLGGITVDAVDPATGTVTSPGGMPYCSHGLGVWDGTLFDLTAFAPSVTLAPQGVINRMDLSTGDTPDAFPVLKEAPVAMAIDPVHGLALVSYTQPQPTQNLVASGLPDNNATGELIEVDLETGKIVKTIAGLQVALRGDPLADGGVYYSLQLDPATRTGWTYGPFGAQVQEFAY